MKKTVLILIAIAVVSCRSYNNFMGYATNDNSQCFSEEIFKIKEEDKILSEHDIKRINKERYKYIKKEDDLYTFSMGLVPSSSSLGYKYSGGRTSKQSKVIKGLAYYENGKISELSFGISGTPIFKEIIYNKQGEIIKDTLYNNYPICWKEALAIAKHRARKEIKKFNVTEFDLAGFVDRRDSIPKWQVILTADGKETREEYLEYLYEQGGEGANKGKRYIVINAQTGEIIRDYRVKRGDYY